jgi:hypothetical protein
MKFFIMVQSFSLCLTGYSGASRSLEKFLKMIFGWPCLALEVTFGCHYALLIGVAGFLITAAIAGHYGDATGSSFQPFLATVGTFPGALNGGLGWCSSIIISGHARIA